MHGNKYVEEDMVAPIIINYYYYYYYCCCFVVVVIVVSCHRPFLPGTSPEPTAIPPSQASSFILQYFPYCVMFLV